MSTRRSFLRFLGLGAAATAIPKFEPEALPPEIARIGIDPELPALRSSDTSVPAISFSNDSDAGIYRADSNTLGIKHWVSA